MESTKSKFQMAKLVKKQRRTESGVTEDVHYHLFHEGLPKEFEKYAAEYLKETKSNTERGMLTLKRYLKDKYTEEIEDDLLLMLLRTSKFDLDKATKKLDYLMRARSRFLIKLAELDLEKIELILEDKPFAFLPYRDREGRAIIYTQPTINMSNYEVYDVLTCFLAMLMYMSKYEMTSLFGFVHIGDSKSTSMKVFYNMVLVYKRHMREWLFFPAMLKSVNVINENFITRWFYNILKPIIHVKVVERTKFHGSDLEGLQEVIHPDLLPEECGGNMGPLSTDFFKDELLNYMKNLKEQHCQRNVVKN